MLPSPSFATRALGELREGVSGRSGFSMMGGRECGITSKLRSKNVIDSLFHRLIDSSVTNSSLWPQ